MAVRIERAVVGRLDVATDVWMGLWMYVCWDGRSDGRAHGRNERRAHGSLGGRTCGAMCGWICQRMFVWMSG